jgi:membrane fusion protein (multidrug efflux system)
MRQALYITFGIIALSYPATAQQQPSTAVPVGVAQAEFQPIAKAGDFVGRVDALSRVEVRARITGYLQEILLKEGDLIKEGTPLYRIEKGLFEAEVKKAEDALARSQATKTLSALQLARAQELVEKQAGTVVARDACTADSDEAHTRSLDVIRKWFGETPTADEVVGALGAPGAKPART